MQRNRTKHKEIEMTEIENDLNAVFQDALEHSMAPEEYISLTQTYSEEGKTTGSKQTDDLINYTKLNTQRSKRVLKQVNVLPELVEKIGQISQQQTWVLLTESWCGDAASSVPVIIRLAELNDKIELRIVLRDSNLALMDQFLTNGGRSIPKLVAVDDQTNVLFSWGPRPVEAQKLYDGWRNAENKIPYQEFQVDLQKWYNSDRGKSLQRELLSLIDG